MQKEKTNSETARLFSEALADAKQSPKNAEGQISDTEPKKVPLKDSEPVSSPSLEPAQFQPIYQKSSANKEKSRNLCGYCK